MPKIGDGGHAQRDIERGLQTKQMVKGAAGGARGVDYSDDEAEYLERRDSAAALNLRASEKESVLAQGLLKAASEGRLPGTAEQIRQAQPGAAQQADGMDARNAVNVNAAQAESDRVDPKVEIAIEKIKKKILTNEDDEDVEEYEEEVEDDDDDGSADEDLPEELVWLGPFADSDVDEALRGVSLDVISALVKDPEAEMRVYGTSRLMDPSDMRSALGTPLRVARHLRVMTERMLKNDQFKRDDVVQYVAGCLVSMGSEFGATALRAFATGVGIGGIYPLEVVNHIARAMPDFVPRTTIAPFLPGRRRRVLRAGKPSVIHCDPDLKITGLALKGGGEPGYQFVPRPTPGEFFLNVLTPGAYTLILSAVDGHGFERVQELRVLVKDPAADSDLSDDEDVVAARQQAVASFRMPNETADPAATAHNESGSEPDPSAVKKKKKKKKLKKNIKKKPLSASAVKSGKQAFIKPTKPKA